MIVVGWEYIGYITFLNGINPMKYNEVPLNLIKSLAA